MYASIIEYGGVNRKVLSKKEFRLAYVIRLPFRLRIGNFFRLQTEIGGPVEICCRNKIDIPHGTVTSIPAGRGKEDLSTDIMFVDETPNVPDWELEHLRIWTGAVNSEPPPGVIDTPRIVNVLNQLIIAYGTIIETPSTVNPIQPLTMGDVHHLIEWRILLLCPEDYSFSDAELLEIFDRPYHQGFKLDSYEAFYKLDNLDDADINAISRIPNAITRQQESVFYEFAFLSKSRTFHHDPSGALLMAVIALEGAHAALVRHVLIPIFNPYGKDAVNKTEDFIRELGMSNLNQMSPFLFMTDIERPSIEQIKKCAKGITIRNQIMHALIDKGGRYKLRQHRYEELTEACSAVLEVYGYYINALEKRRAGLQQVRKESWIGYILRQLRKVKDMLTGRRRLPSRPR